MLAAPAISANRHKPRPTQLLFTFTRIVIGAGNPIVVGAGNNLVIGTGA
jgi:hypothetical protein